MQDIFVLIGLESRETGVKWFSVMKYFQRHSAIHSIIPTMLATNSIANADMMFTNPTDINMSELVQSDLGFTECCLLNLSKTPSSPILLM